MLVICQSTIFHIIIEQIGISKWADTSATFQNERKPSWANVTRIAVFIADLACQQ